MYTGEDWYNTRQTLKTIAKNKLSNLSINLPFSIRKAAAQLHSHFKTFLEVQDLDE